MIKFAAQSLHYSSLLGYFGRGEKRKNENGRISEWQRTGERSGENGRGDERMADEGERMEAEEGRE